VNVSQAKKLKLPAKVRYEGPPTSTTPPGVYTAYRRCWHYDKKPYFQFEEIVNERGLHGIHRAEYCTVVEEAATGD
jgi:hypothetical protein